MEDLDRILDQFTDPLAGSLHGAVFIAIDKSGTFFCVLFMTLQLSSYYYLIRVCLVHR